MEITRNWLKSGRRSKKDVECIINIYGNKAGSIGESSWDDYVQIKIYNKEEGRFLRLTLTPEEAKRVNEQLNEQLSKF